MLTGCDNSMTDQTPACVNNLQRPVTIIAINPMGIIFQGHDGSIVTIDSNYYTAKILIASGATNGQVFLK